MKFREFSEALMKPSKLIQGVKSKGRQEFGGFESISRIKSGSQK